MNKSSISFIIPAHNSGTTLENTVNSIIKHHTGRNIEILIIENGSTDDTEVISKRICNQYKFIKLLKSDIGVSKARNVGIFHATGDWIVFVDSDDLISDDIVSYLPNSYNYEEILILFGIEKRHNKKIILKQVYTGLENRIDTKIFQFLFYNTDYMLGCICGKIYSRLFLLNNNLYFNETLTYAEDIEFILRVIAFVNECRIVHKCGYIYNINENSATQKFNNEITDEYIKSMKEIIGNKKISKNCISHIVLDHLIFTVFKVSFHPQNGTYKECCVKLKNLLDESIYTGYLKNICYKQYTLKKRTILFCLQKQLFFVVLIMTKINYLIKSVR